VIGLSVVALWELVGVFMAADGSVFVPGTPVSPVTSVMFLVAVLGPVGMILVGVAVAASSSQRAG